MANDDRDVSLFGFIVLCWRACGRGLKNLGIFILKSFRLAVQYYWIMIIAVALGIGAAAWWSRTEVSTYRGDATIIFTEGMRAPVIDGINLFITRLYADGERYGISERQKKAFKKLKYKNVIDAKRDSVPDFVDMYEKISYSDTVDVVMMDRLHLILKLKGEPDFSVYQNAISAFIRDNKAIAAADRYYKTIADARLDYLNREVVRLDSFMIYDYFIKPRHLKVEHWGARVVTEREQKLYHGALLSVISNRDFVKTQIQRTPDVINFQTDFIVTVLPKPWKYVIGIAVGCIIGLLVALLVKYWKRVTAYMKEK